MDPRLELDRHRHADRRDDHRAVFSGHRFGQAASVHFHPGTRAAETLTVTIYHSLDAGSTRVACNTFTVAAGDAPPKPIGPPVPGKLFRIGVKSSAGSNQPTVVIKHAIGALNGAGSMALDFGLSPVRPRAVAGSPAADGGAGPVAGLRVGAGVEEPARDGCRRRRDLDQTGLSDDDGGHERPRRPMRGLVGSGTDALRSSRADAHFLRATAAEASSERRQKQERRARRLA